MTNPITMIKIHKFCSNNWTTSTPVFRAKNCLLIILRDQSIRMHLVKVTTRIHSSNNIMGIMEKMIRKQIKMEKTLALFPRTQKIYLEENISSVNVDMRYCRKSWRHISILASICRLSIKAYFSAWIMKLMSVK